MFLSRALCIAAAVALLATLVPAQASGKWVKGANGKNCNEVCSGAGGSCDSAMQSSLTTDDKVKDAFASVGYTCKGFHPAENYDGAPFSTGREDDCAPIKAGGRASSCTGNIYGHHAALCYCKPTLVPAQASGKWIKGANGKSKPPISSGSSIFEDSTWTQGSCPHTMGLSGYSSSGTSHNTVDKCKQRCAEVGDCAGVYFSKGKYPTCHTYYRDASWNRLDRGSLCWLKKPIQRKPITLPTAVPDERRLSAPHVGLAVVPHVGLAVLATLWCVHR